MARPQITPEEFEKMKAEDLEKLKSCLLITDGRVVPSSKELFVEGMKAPRNIREQVEGIIGSYLFQQALKAQGHETLEEAEDLDIPDEPMDRLDIPTGIEVYDLIPDDVPHESLSVPPEEKKDFVEPEVAQVEKEASEGNVEPSEAE